MHLIRLLRYVTNVTSNWPRTLVGLSRITLPLPLKQPWNAPGSDLLGYGYDAAGRFARGTHVLQVPLFDLGPEVKSVSIRGKQYLVPNSIELNGVNLVDFTTVSGRSKYEYQRNFSIKVTAGGSYGLFSREVTLITNFNTSTDFENSLTSVTLQGRRIRAFITHPVTQLQTMLTPDAQALINSNQDPDEVIKRCGTHFLKSIYPGGAIAFHMRTDMTRYHHATETQIAAEAALAGFLKTSTHITDKETIDDFNQSTQVRIEIVGGSPAHVGDVSSNRYDPWLASVENDSYPELCDIDVHEGLIPIWLLARNPGRAKHLQNEIEAYLSRYAPSEPPLAPPGLVLGLRHSKTQGLTFVNPQLDASFYQGGDLGAPGGEGFALWMINGLGINPLSYSGKLPPGLVFGLKHSVNNHGDPITAFGMDAATGPTQIPGFVKMHGGDLGGGASAGQGYYWYESIDQGFNEWDLVKKLPRGTLLCLKHSANQPNKTVVWQGKTYDPVSNAAPRKDLYGSTVAI